MIWVNDVSSYKDSSYGCCWAGSANGGSDGNLTCGIDNECSLLAGNHINLYTNLEAVDSPHFKVTGIKTFLIAGAVDNEVGNEKGISEIYKA